MAFPRLSASMLLASLILLLYWTTSSAQSHDPASSDPSPPYRVKRSLLLPSRTRETVSASLTAAKESITYINGRFAKADSLSGVMKGLANIASWGSQIGGLVSAFANLILVFIPQDDSVLNEVKKGFADVNRKLDSLSIQISNLATDVEWFNYASVYSQDEVRILNAWKKFEEFKKDIVLIQTDVDRLRMGEIFVNYYESSGTEISVANLYHYLTVEHTSLSGNLNELLKKKFKCDMRQIFNYNVYFSTLLWKGMFLNQFYWKLIGFDLSGKEAEHKGMFEKVLTMQTHTLQHCLYNYKQYMESDVVDIRKELGPDNKAAIAEQVKSTLENKYFWYNWVVLVYNTNEESYYILYDMTKITTDTITIAVGFTLKAQEIDKDQVIKSVDECFREKSCEIKDKVPGCRHFITVTQDGVFGVKRYDIRIREYVKATHAAYGTEFAEAPKPFHQHDCWWGQSTRKISVHYSRKLPACSENPCLNNGRCDNLLDSNDWMCICQDGFYGDRCEKMEHISSAALSLAFRVPDLSVIVDKMLAMETKLQKKQDEILKIMNERCPRVLQISAN